MQIAFFVGNREVKRKLRETQAGTYVYFNGKLRDIYVYPQECQKYSTLIGKLKGDRRNDREDSVKEI